MFQTDEKLFAQLQKNCCWFTFPLFEKLPEVDPNTDVMLDEALWQDDACVQRHIFAMIFGGFGYRVNLTRAKSTALIKLGQIEKQEPEDKSVDNPKFLEWLGLFAQYNILLGTVFAYQRNYTTAAALLMNGLKTRAVNLFMPYCDFIKYVLSKVEKIPTEISHYDGCGFCSDEPMGSTELNGGSLSASAAEIIISALEGNNGEIILSYIGGQKYGNLKRLGSVKSDKFKNCIDVYEVLAIDRKFTPKKIRFYFNGYFSQQSNYTIKLPKGFRLDPLSEAAQIFRVVENNVTV